jgi:hypothetical protein
MYKTCYVANLLRAEGYDKVNLKPFNFKKKETGCTGFLR